MDRNDVTHIIRFTDSEGWGYDERDIHRMIGLSPGGCFLGIEGSQGKVEIIGMITTISYGAVGWIGNLLVQRERRKQGIGMRLMEKGITHIRREGAPTVSLHSYMQSEEFYKKLGFKRIEVFKRYHLDPQQVTRSPIPKEVCRIDEELLEQVVLLDKVSHGGDRSEMLRATWSDFPTLSYAWLDPEKKVTGFILGRGSEKGYEIGPWICSRGCRRPGALLDAILGSIPGDSVEISVREKGKKEAAVIRSRGFAEGYKTVTMHLGPFYEYPMKDDLWAIAALEKG